jgi:predicted O-methyltransferase YrrM
MTWEEIERWAEWAKAENPGPELLAREIYSGSHPNPYYNFLRKLAIETKEPGVFLEIGCFYGCLAAHLERAATPLIHIGIDINLVPFSGQNSIMIRGDSVGVCDNHLPTIEVVKRIAEKCGGIQYVFQDSSHRYEESAKEWDLYAPLVKRGGLWICDDIIPAFQAPDEPKGQVEYFEELPGDKRLFNGLHIGNTIGIVRL